MEIDSTPSHIMRKLVKDNDHSLHLPHCFTKQIHINALIVGGQIFINYLPLAHVKKIYIGGQK